MGRPDAGPRRDLDPDDLLLGEREGRAALRWLRDESIKGATTVRVLVSTRDYTGRVYPEWCDVTHVSPGDASRYPVKANIVDRGSGQWSFDEVLAVALTDTGRMILSNTPHKTAITERM